PRDGRPRCSPTSTTPHTSVSSTRLARGPGSPLFPYTTLFRSPALGHQIRRSRQHGAHGRTQSLGEAEHNGVGRRHYVLPLQGTGDRKSTRLNSSHVASSYAVFWLKKKNTRRARARHPSGRALP